MVQLTFDANDVKPDEGGGGQAKPLDPGTYVVQVIQSEIKTYGKGANPREKLSLRYQLDEEAHPGMGKRLIFDDFLMWHDKKDVADWMRSRFSALCRAVGKMKVADTEDLHFIPFQVEVYHKDRDGQVDLKVARYKRLADAERQTQTDSEEPPW